MQTEDRPIDPILWHCVDTCQTCDVGWANVHYPHIIEPREASFRMSYKCRRCARAWETEWQTDLALSHAEQWRVESMEVVGELPEECLEAIDRQLTQSEYNLSGTANIIAEHMLTMVAAFSRGPVDMDEIIGFLIASLSRMRSMRRH